MVSVLVEAFRDLQVRLAETIERHETPEFKALDGDIARVFLDICRHAPRDAQEARTMAGFFLDLIEDNDAGDNTHLIQHVRTIVETCGGLRAQVMEIAHGAGI
ncbi:hypothetical protein JQ506_12545 [Shinella sp. PSBB067]|uniref:hypothetical protein n=1 Tax=Shinella sp. PSBB067 TaxID=2715959 RepID=UPI00193BB02A|nr:hypothetical protein [Shinella sp. PSBB067]QRI65741.1 hypothetical protein JQ506_12545 [Shinella sp. PSBB067]